MSNIKEQKVQELLPRASMDKFICPYCGVELDYTPKDAQFCEQCGANLSLSHD